MGKDNERCLFVAHDGGSQIGGVHTWLETLIPMLRDRGLKCSTALFLRNGEGFLTHQLRQSGIDVSTCSHFDPFLDRVRWLKGVIEKTQANVVIPNYLVAGFAATMGLRAKGVRTVAVLHSDDPFYRALIECQRSNDSALTFDYAIPVSCFLEGVVHERLGKDFPSTRIPCGIVLNNNIASPASVEFRLVYVGRLVQEQKRICDLAAAFCRVVREIPGVTADIIGDGDDRKAVEAVLVANGSPRQVRLLGALTPVEVRQQLSQYHAKVLLSDYEGLPVALLEAMASGLVPICMTMRSGINELVVDRKTGLIVADREAGFVSAVRELVQNPSLWSALSKRAREQVQEFDAERCAARWVKVINGIANIQAAATPAPNFKRMSFPQWRPEFEWDMQRGQSHSAQWSPFEQLVGNLRGRLGSYRRKIFKSRSIRK